MKMLTSLVALAALLTAAQAEARENRLLKCRAGKARAAPSGGGPALVANVAKSMTPIDLNAVQMTDRKLTRSMVVEGLFARRTAVDTLQVTARFVNCTNAPMVVQARTSFIDEQQVPTENASVWKTVFLPPRTTGTYQETSIGTGNVAAYLIELRSGQ